MRIIKKTVPVCLVIAVAGICSPVSALAQDNSMYGSIPSSGFDADNDGLISKKEFSSVFSRFDTNADGKLNHDELMAGRREMMDKHFEMLRKQRMTKMPGNMPGRMSGNRGRMMPAFDDFDLNGDGKLPEDEFNAARAKRMSKMAEQGRMMKRMAQRPSFADIDLNNDGAIDRAEFRKHQSEHRLEMRKHQAMMREKRMQERRETRRNMQREKEWQPWDMP